MNSASDADPRHIGREGTINLLYEAEIKGLDIQELLEELPLIPDDFVLEMAKGIHSDIKNLNEAIVKFSPDWPLERMPSIDRAVLRLAAYELKHSDTPVAVILNEAVEISKEYSTENSGRFVNGVLASLAKEFREE